MFHIKRVYNYYLFTTMQKDFITGLKLKNSLSNSLVSYLLISGTIRTYERKKRKVVHMWTYSLLKQSHGTCQVTHF